MIIKNICLLLEMLSITMCLHQLYGEKYRLDIETVSLLAIDMVMMQAIDYFGLPSMLSISMYPIIVIYCGVRFGFEMKPILMNVILCIMIVGGIQGLVVYPICYMLDIHYFVGGGLIVVTLISFAIVAFLLPLMRLERISFFLQHREKVTLYSVLACLLMVLVWLVAYKDLELIELGNTFTLFMCIAFILMLSVQLVKYKIKAKEAEIELKMQQIYSEPFQRLVDNIRLRQHEFDNHINAIYSQHFAYHTYEELVEAQRSYCKQITKDNRFNRLLAQDNSVIRGFLYTKFLEIDKMGIEVSYQISIKELNIGIPVYKMVEILGDLINNAVEALEADEGRNRLHVSIIDSDVFYIEVRNVSPYIAYEMIGNFFSKGFSRKGENRGLGLYNVKKICDEYGFGIFPNNVLIDEDNWFSFKVLKIDK